jgi:hypothetical protein
MAVPEEFRYAAMEQLGRLSQQLDNQLLDQSAKYGGSYGDDDNHS